MASADNTITAVGQSVTETDGEENVCPICCQRKPAADDDGHCSYECASGGGWTAPAEDVEIAEFMSNLTRPAIRGTCKVESCVCAPASEVMWITVNEKCGLCGRRCGTCDCTEDDFCQANADGYFNDSP